MRVETDKIWIYAKLNCRIVIFLTNNILLTIVSSQSESEKGSDLLKFMVTAVFGALFFYH